MLNQESQRTLTNMEKLTVDSSSTSPFTYPNQPALVEPNPKIFISEDIEYRAGTPTKSPVFGDNNLAPDHPSFEARTTNQFTTQVVETKFKQEPSRYELKPTFNDYSAAPYVTSSSY